MSEIREMRKRLVLHCAYDDSIMEMTAGKYSLYYCCPRYFRANRMFYEKSCLNRISPRTFDVICSYLSLQEEEEMLEPGLKTSLPGADIEVLFIANDMIHISVCNQNREDTRKEEKHDTEDI